MKVKIITLNTEDSQKSSSVCDESSKKVGNDFELEKFEAVTPDKVVGHFLKLKIKWNYPFNGEQYLDIQTGLMKKGYATKDPKKRMACFLSHYSLWKECLNSMEDYVILEDDAIFIDKLDTDVIESSDRSIISLNRPQPGATPKAIDYANKIYAESNGQTSVVNVPYLFDRQVPAGLPGNSAYYIKPSGAKKLLRLVSEFGAWPNDAIMCKQLLPRDLGCLYPYVTEVQKTKSSTTL